MAIIVYKMAVSSTSAANGWFSHREVWPPSLGANFLYRVGEALEAWPQTFGGQAELWVVHPAALPALASSARTALWRGQIVPSSWLRRSSRCQWAL